MRSAVLKNKDDKSYTEIVTILALYGFKILVRYKYEAQRRSLAEN